MSVCPPINGSSGSPVEELVPSLNSTFGPFYHGDRNWTYMEAHLQSMYCAADWPGTCMGLCANADISGPGVRVAFYFQSITSAALMAISPEDAQAACWSAAILTASVIIPAMVQKSMKTLTLHHAMLCLNFATMSAVASLASAPVCDVWRAPDFPEQEHPAKQGRNGRSATLATTGLRIRTADDTENDCRRRDVTTHSGQESLPSSPSVAVITGDEFRKIKWASSGYRSRFFLSLALLTQVSLQWAWAVFLFTSPSYAQEACNEGTQILLFGVPMTVGSMNEHAKYYVLFPLWLLACMSVTLLYVIALAYNSMVEYPLVHMPNASSLSGSSNWILRMVVGTLEWTRRAWAEPYGEKKRILYGNGVAAGIWAILVVHSEVQVGILNCVIGGEDSDFGFGQFSALMLAVVPIWSIIVALSKERAGNLQESRSFAESTAPTLHLRDTGSLSLELERLALLRPQTRASLVPESPQTPSPSTSRLMLPATPLPASPESALLQWPEQLPSPSSSPSSKMLWPSSPPTFGRIIQSPPPPRRNLETDGGLGFELEPAMSVPIVVTPPAEDAAR